MMVCEIKDMAVIEPLFRGRQETFIRSCLQGYMGLAFADHPRAPRAAQIVLGDICFFAGEPNSGLVRNKPAAHSSGCFILIPPDGRWQALIERELGERAARRTRYATRKARGAFDEAALRMIVSALPAPYALRAIDRELYGRALSLDWARDWCAQFSSYEHYQSCGLGVAVMKGDAIVSGASSYAAYRGGIEVQIDTRSDERRKGLALACGAKLILECLARGLSPSWDADSIGSLRLAEKLGYRLDKEYPVYDARGF